jgi:hypothetical protein
MPGITKVGPHQRDLARVHVVHGHRVLGGGRHQHVIVEVTQDLGQRVAHRDFVLYDQHGLALPVKSVGSSAAAAAAGSSASAGSVKVNVVPRSVASPTAVRSWPGRD